MQIFHFGLQLFYFRPIVLQFVHKRLASLLYVPFFSIGHFLITFTNLFLLFRTGIIRILVRCSKVGLSQVNEEFYQVALKLPISFVFYQALSTSLIRQVPIRITGNTQIAKHLVISEEIFTHTLSSTFLKFQKVKIHASVWQYTKLIPVDIQTTKARSLSIHHSVCIGRKHRVALLSLNHTQFHIEWAVRCLSWQSNRTERVFVRLSIYSHRTFKETIFIKRTLDVVICFFKILLVKEIIDNIIDPIDIPYIKRCCKVRCVSEDIKQRPQRSTYLPDRITLLCRIILS